MVEVTGWFDTQTEAHFNVPFEYQNDKYRLILEQCNMNHKMEYRYSVIRNAHI